ncbi:hypothetical protein GCM10009809_07950 [Isoptericola hypogeus]|uniref:HTH arsR-type domain-containing protein n=1 Tax=Isoptericola hypogeus TaxID=300179 RepID=A0ABP4V0Y0_9MICO
MPDPNPRMETMEVRDPETLRAIAHPVRQRILMQLAVLDHARAADLAAAIGQPANSVSFHLRVLAKAGMIVEAPEHARDKRDRVWTNVATSYNVKPSAGGAADLILRPTVEWLTEVFAHGEHEETRGTGRTFMLTTMLLTHDEGNELVHELSELLNRWSERSLAAARDGADTPREVYQVLTAVAPRDDPDGTREAARERETTD